MKVVMRLPKTSIKELLRPELLKEQVALCRGHNLLTI